MRVSNRFEISMRCPKFDYSYFPFDAHNCSIILRGPTSAQNLTLINVFDNIATLEEFSFESLNLQYAIEAVEFDVSDAKDSTSYVGATLKLTRYFPPYSK